MIRRGAHDYQCYFRLLSTVEGWRLVDWLISLSSTNDRLRFLNIIGYCESSDDVVPWRALFRANSLTACSEVQPSTDCIQYTVVSMFENSELAHPGMIIYISN